MKINISTLIYPTEDADKVKKAVEDIFPNVKFKITKSKMSGQALDVESLSKIKDIVEKKRIRATIRYLLLEHGNLMLNKQTAVIGKINFVEEEHTLGNINVNIDDIDRALEYLTK